jgi:DNA repair exonuclease SbcCD ATPase subunit
MSIFDIEEEPVESVQFDVEGQDEGHSNEFTEEQHETEKTEELGDALVSLGGCLISAILIKQVEELLNGGRLEKISNNEELENSVKLLSQCKKVRKDFEVEGEKLVAPKREAYQTVQKAVKEKVDALKSLEDNLGNKGAEFQKLERERLAKEQKDRDEKAAAERKRLAAIEDAKIAEEEELRAKSDEKLASVDEISAKLETYERKKSEIAAILVEETDPEKKVTLLKKNLSLNKTIAKLVERKNALLKQSNDLVEQANTNLEEAKKLEEQIHDISAAPPPTVQTKVATPLGFKGKTEYSAEVTDHWEALKALVTMEATAYLMSAALKKCIESAANAMAKDNEMKFVLPGATLKQREVGGKGMRK